MTHTHSLATAIILMAGLAHAQAPTDRAWTKEAFLAAHPDATEELFAFIDLSGDGVIDPDEYHLAVAVGVITPSKA